jgi:hypothetical protein
MKNLECAFGNVELITVDRFLEMLSVRELNPKTRRFSYNTLISSPAANWSPEGITESTSDYERKEAFLSKGDTKSILKTALFYQANFTHMYSAKKEEILENLVTNHTVEMGSTNYLVRVAPRTWMAASLTDFEVVKNRHGFGLACLARVRTQITTVDRNTLGQVQQLLSDFTGE